MEMQPHSSRSSDKEECSGDIESTAERTLKDDNNKNKVCSLTTC